MMARAAWMQKESEHLGHYAACDPKRNLQRRNEEKCTYYPLMRKRNGLRIMFREKPLGQESELKMQRRQFIKRRKI
jgi:hypothetical protein